LVSFFRRRLCAAVGNAIKIWDLESKVITQTLVPDNLPEPVANGHGIQHRALCLTWQNDGNVLFVGYTDSKIRVFHVMSA
jgi:guanine nucleotide-binding protein subunit beta-2-like 1 protein